MSGCWWTLVVVLIVAVDGRGSAADLSRALSDDDIYQIINLATTEHKLEGKPEIYYAAPPGHSPSPSPPGPSIKEINHPGPSLLLSKDYGRAAAIDALRLRLFKDHRNYQQQVLAHNNHNYLQHQHQQHHHHHQPAESHQKHVLVHGGDGVDPKSGIEIVSSLELPSEHSQYVQDASGRFVEILKASKPNIIDGTQKAEVTTILPFPPEGNHIVEETQILSSPTGSFNPHHHPHPHHQHHPHANQLLKSPPHSVKTTTTFLTTMNIGGPHLPPPPPQFLSLNGIHAPAPVTPTSPASSSLPSFFTQPYPPVSPSPAPPTQTLLQALTRNPHGGNRIVQSTPPQQHPFQLLQGPSPAQAAALRAHLMMATVPQHPQHVTQSQNNHQLVHQQAVHAALTKAQEVSGGNGVQESPNNNQITQTVQLPPQQPRQTLVSPFGQPTLQNPLQNPLQNALQNPLQNALQNPLQNALQNPLQNGPQYAQPQLEVQQNPNGEALPPPPPHPSVLQQSFYTLRVAGQTPNGIPLYHHSVISNPSGNPGNYLDQRLQSSSVAEGGTHQIPPNFFSLLAQPSSSIVQHQQHQQQQHQQEQEPAQPQTLVVEHQQQEQQPPPTILQQSHLALQAAFIQPQPQQEQAAGLVQTRDAAGSAAIPQSTPLALPQHQQPTFFQIRPTYVSASELQAALGGGGGLQGLQGLQEEEGEVISESPSEQVIEEVNPEEGINPTFESNTDDRLGNNNNGRNNNNNNEEEENGNYNGRNNNEVDDSENVIPMYPVVVNEDGNPVMLTSSEESLVDQAHQHQPEVEIRHYNGEPVVTVKTRRIITSPRHSSSPSSFSNNNQNNYDNNNNQNNYDYAYDTYGEDDRDVTRSVLTTRVVARFKKPRTRTTTTTPAPMRKSKRRNNKRRRYNHSRHSSDLMTSA